MNFLYLLIALAYFIWPVDIILDFIPLLGWTDDAAVALACLYQMSKS